MLVSASGKSFRCARWRVTVGGAVEATLLDQGIRLMAVGMGTVFVFLTVLVVGMSLLSLITAKYELSDSDNTGASDEEIAAISAAIATHKNKK